MKFNKKMLFGTIGALIAGIFGIIAFFGLKFDGEMSLSDLGKGVGSDAPAWYNAIYGCGVAGLVIAFIGMVFPLVSMFYSNEKLDKAFGILSVVFAVLGLVLMLASLAVFAGESGSELNAGYTAGQFIFVIVGGALSIAGNVVSCKEVLAK